MNRAYSPFDKLIIQFDQAVQTVFGRPQVTERPDPASGLEESELTEAERDHTARLMRINHTGEVCAQALYQGQAVTAKDPAVRQNMERSAQEENDHLDWCERRIHELGGRTSLLNPLWYAGSFAIGAAAGIAGDKWSLGFIAETEKQVCAHLDSHLEGLPAEDAKSRAIVEQMRDEEEEHGDSAREAGAAELPGPVKHLMRLTAKVMTKTAYWV